MEVLQVAQARGDVLAKPIVDLFKLSVLRDDKLPMAGERKPVSPREGRLSSTTCRCPPLPQHFTPSQLQYPPAAAALPFHEANGSPFPTPSIAAALKASSAASSFADAAASIEMDMEMHSNGNSELCERIAIAGLLWYVRAIGSRPVFAK
jgi:hypothetical protein